MKVVLVHDYLNAYGGAERVLSALSEMYPEAPIYTAFMVPGSAAAERFKDKRIIESWAAKIPGFRSKLHSPLRFLIPLIWEQFDLDEFDVVISSSAAFMSKGVLTRPETLHVCYCHTPPRFLYGYDTAGEYGKYWPVRAYASWVSKGLRQYDFLSSQRVDVMVANSENVRRRIEKFYRRESVVVYPPVELRAEGREPSSEKRLESVDSHPSPLTPRSYFLTGGRLVKGKHFELVVEACKQLDLRLKVFGEGPLLAELKSMAGSKTEFVGRVSDEALWGLHAGAQAFVALSEDEDFGITPVEAMAAGCPVLAYRGGGYVETILEGVTGWFVDDLTVDTVKNALVETQNSKLKTQYLLKQASTFSKERFVVQMRELIEGEYKKYKNESDLSS